MSYVRWSSKVRRGCGTCGDTGFVALTDGDRAELGSLADRLPGRFCEDCTSCWYIYAHVDGHLDVNHGRCPSTDERDHWMLDAEGAGTWEPPADCPMRDVAIEAARAYSEAP